MDGCWCSKKTMGMNCVESVEAAIEKVKSAPLFPPVTASMSENETDVWLISRFNAQLWRLLDRNATLAPRFQGFRAPKKWQLAGRVRKQQHTGLTTGGSTPQVL